MTPCGSVSTQQMASGSQPSSEILPFALESSQHTHSQMVKAQKIRDGGVLSPKCNIYVRSLHPKTQRPSHKRCQKDCKRQRQRRTSVKQLLLGMKGAYTQERSEVVIACLSLYHIHQILSDPMDRGGTPELPPLLGTIGRSWIL
ncbi:hypothetical protein LEMLEM_LOCUS6491, partial [Lemmus lemmus]